MATFYTQYKRHPNGKYTVGVCTNTLCAVMGGDAIFDALTDHLGIGHDETTEDGAITLERIECNAACDYAPVVMVNWEFFDNQTPASAEELVDALRAGKPVAPTRGAATVATFKEVSRVLAGFPDGRADEGVGAGPGLPAGHRCWPGETRLDGPRGRGRAGPTVQRDTRARKRRPRAENAMATTLTPILSEHWDEARSWTLDSYERHGGYQALRRALAMPPEDVVGAVKDSGLRGRGGAGFPTGLKWGFLPKPDGEPRYLVVNADESEPGTCKDIPLMMASPQHLIEGVIITSFAIGCSKAFIYLRGEVVHVYRRLLRAVEEAKDKGYLGRNILGSGFDLDVIGARRGRRVHLRRGDRAARLARGSSRPAPAEAAVPRGRRPVRAADGGQQRRVDRVGAGDRRQRSPTGSSTMGTERSTGLRVLLAVGARHPAGPVRGPARHHPARAARHGRRGATRARR